MDRRMRRIELPPVACLAKIRKAIKSRISTLFKASPTMNIPSRNSITSGLMARSASTGLICPKSNTATAPMHMICQMRR